MKSQLITYFLRRLVFVPLAAVYLLPLPAAAQCPGGQCGIQQYQYVQPPPSYQQPPVQQPQTTPEAVNTALTNVVTITNRGNGFGSGVYLGNGYVLTARHIFVSQNGQKEEGLTDVSFLNGSASRGEIVDLDPEWDLCMIRLADPPKSVPPIKWATTIPVKGEGLYACGYGQQGVLKRLFGRLVQFTRPNNSRGAADTLVMTGGARPGDSGGPVFNTRGELAGILWGTDDRTIVATQVGRCWLFARRWLIVSIPNQQAPQQQAPLPTLQEPTTASDMSDSSLSIEVAQLRTEIEVLRDALAVVNAKQGPPGPQGPAGPPGPRGEHGLAASVDTDALAEAIKQKIQGSIRVKVEPVKPQ